MPMNFRFLVLLSASILTSHHAVAACSNPAGDASDQFYNTTFNVMQYCNGTDWVNMGASTTVSGDNLGDHTATGTLYMAGNPVWDATSLYLRDSNGNNSKWGSISNADDVLYFQRRTPTTGALEASMANLNLTTGAFTATSFIGDGSGLTGIAGDNLGNHTATTNIVLGSNWLNGDSGSEGVSIGTTGIVQIDQAGPGSTYDIYLKGGSGTSGTTRRLALLGTEAGMLYLNYGTEYASGVTIGGNIAITAGALSDSSITSADIAAGAVNSSEIATGAVDLAHLSATGTKNSTTFLRGDNTWAAPTATVSDGLWCGYAVSSGSGNNVCPTTYTSSRTCNGSSIASSCPTGYTALVFDSTGVANGCGLGCTSISNCKKVCTKD